MLFNWIFFLEENKFVYLVLLILFLGGRYGYICGDFKDNFWVLSLFFYYGFLGLNKGFQICLVSDFIWVIELFGLYWVYIFYVYKCFCCYYVIRIVRCRLLDFRLLDVVGSINILREF